MRIENGRRVSIAAIREAVREIEPARAVYAAGGLEEFLAASIRQPRLNAILLSLFAVTTLLLAGVGLYGVLSQAVASRRREIGLRMALGARPAQILASIATQAAAVTLLGIGTGLAGAAVLARFMTSFVFDISQGIRSRSRQCRSCSRSSPRPPRSCRPAARRQQIQCARCAGNEAVVSRQSAVLSRQSSVISLSRQCD